MPASETTGTPALATGYRWRAEKNKTMDASDDPTQIDHYLDARLASDQANRCRRLAQSVNDRETARILEDMADEYDRLGSAIG